jgi:hypothetical protein
LPFLEDYWHLSFHAWQDATVCDETGVPKAGPLISKSRFVFQIIASCLRNFKRYLRTQKSQNPLS